MDYVIFRDIAVILVAGKYMGLLARKWKAPQVAGEILVSLLIGPCLLGLVQPSDFLTQMAELGVVLLMFSAGLDSDIDEIIKSGPIALLVAMCGVLLPLAAGTALYIVFYGFDGLGSDSFYHALFMGCILTATSVSITVQALRELGHLKTRVGTTILSAAIIDDVLGIIVLTVITGFKDASTSPVKVLADTGLFFLFSGVIGYLVYQVFERMSLRHPRTKRLTVLGLAFCFLMSYLAEEFFGIADITGAYVATWSCPICGIPMTSSAYWMSTPIPCSAPCSSRRLVSARTSAPLIPLSWPSPWRSWWWGCSPRSWAAA